MNEDCELFVRKLVFSYIISIDGKTRLIVYNFSTITGVEGIIHRGGKVVIEVTDGYIFVFTSDNFHAEMKYYDRRNGA